jgi:phytoene synthase
VADPQHPLDADRLLALSYVPQAARRAMECLWRLDAVLGAAVAGGSQPLTRQMKLAWWRESLEGLGDSGGRGEPLLERVAKELLSRGISGTELARLAEGWEYLVSEEPLSPDDRNSYAMLRGATLFSLSAELLAVSDSRVVAAGEGWALVDLARHSGEPTEAEAAMAHAGQRLIVIAGHWPVRLRPLGMLAALARRDVERGLRKLEPPGAPARMLRMFWFRLTGR